MFLGGMLDTSTLGPVPIQLELADPTAHFPLDLTAVPPLSVEPHSPSLSLAVRRDSAAMLITEPHPPPPTAGGVSGSSVRSSPQQSLECQSSSASPGPTNDGKERQRGATAAPPSNCTCLVRQTLIDAAGSGPLSPTAAAAAAGGGGASPKNPFAMQCYDCYRMEKERQVSE
eukprot:GHVU01205369.1.p2 GENE.GHVU01205369.1~~GHVU01205369.1.p2  ORF type:complete len:172 (+),score=38.06 GHVU01205369.1:250-765(+)